MMQDRASELVHAHDHLQRHTAANSLAMECRRLRREVEELKAVVALYEEMFGVVGADSQDDGGDAEADTVRRVPQPISADATA